MIKTESQKHSAARIVGVLAVIFGILFSYFFFEKAPGISVPIYFFLLTATIAVLHINLSKRKASDLWLAIPTLFFASMVAVRGSFFLGFLNVAASIGLTFLMIKNVTGLRTRFLTIWDYVMTFVRIPVDYFVSEVDFLKSLVKPEGERPQSGNVKRILTGLVIAVPLLIIFTKLFSSADPIFGGYVNSIFTLHISGEWIGRVILFLISGAVVSVTLWSLLTSTHKEEAQDSGSNSTAPSRTIEIATFLGSIATLFLSFIFLQINYLFGGEINIVHAGFTYAEYARHGFWELLAVAVITLVLLVAAEKIADFTKSKRAALTIPAIIIIGEVFVIIASAFKRLSLYVFTYGETALRFYVASFIIFLFVIFAILLYKIIQTKKESFFMHGVLLSLITAMVVFNLVNPEAFIAKKNFDLYEKTGKIDVDYLSSLSSDAIPVMLANAGKLGDQNDELLNVLSTKKRGLSEGDSSWQSSNYSRSQAHELLIGVYLPSPEGE
jgi:Domain of unknown function (DUF4173)